MRPPVPLIPYRPFFIAVALDALLGVAVWPVAAFGWIPSIWMGVPLAIWHRQEMLAGVMPAALAGFLLTALPRWVGCPPISARRVCGMLGLWLTGRVAHLCTPAAAGPLATLFIAWLTFEVAQRVIAARNRRNYKIVGLLVLLTLGTALAGDHPLASPDAYGARLSMAALLGLVMILGGRIIPALSLAYLSDRFRSVSPSAGIEAAAALIAALALCAWIWVPAAPATSLLCIAAALAQAIRLARWRGWHAARTAGLFFLHVGYAWLVAGFALIALAAPADGPRALHAWTMGGIGLTCLCVMASMIRRQTGIAFTSSRRFTAAAHCALLAVLLRLMPASAGLVLSAVLWMAAHVLFLVAFGRILCATPAQSAPLQNLPVQDLPVQDQGTGRQI